MADGYVRPLIADGIYLDLPLADYLADPALSGSAFKRLLTDPAGLYWESDANPLWLKPERSANRARLRGHAAHCAILEGLDAYAARYAVKPEGVLESSADLKRYLSAERQRRIAASSDGKLSKEDAQAVKQTGEREDLIARVHAIDPKVRIFDPDDSVDTLQPSDDQYVRLLERFVRQDATFAPLVRDGLAEVSIFWTEHGVRFKARIDYLTAHTVLDIKTFGRPPRRGRCLREHCVMEAIYNGYDLQAVHNHRAVAVAAERYLDQSDGAFHISAGAAYATPRLVEFENMLRTHRESPPVFRWLFLRMGGAPTGISLPFRESDGQWHETSAQITAAIDTYRDMRERFGSEMWLVTHGEQEIAFTDWPLAGIGGEIDVPSEDMV